MERDQIALAIGALLALMAVAALSVSIPLPGSSDTVGPVEGNAPDATPEPPDLPNAPTGLGEVFLVALVLAFAGSLFAIRQLRYGLPAEKPDFGGDPAPNPDTGETPERTRARDEAERAAERIADSTTDTGLENEVYRAWYGMTRALGVRDPRSETPGRFADLAIQAGMDEDTVTELTELFNDVRYGERTLTDRDEERAVELLRRLAAGESEE